MLGTHARRPVEGALLVADGSVNAALTLEGEKILDIRYNWEFSHSLKSPR